MSNLALSEETAVSPSEVFLDGESITEIDLESTCVGIVTRLHETGDIQEISKAITNLNGVEKFAARAKSKLIFEWSQWYKDNNDTDDFPDWFVQKFGGEKLTVQKHQAIGELLMDDSVPDNVKALNSKELVSVSRARQSGYDLSGRWDDIALAGSEAEVNAIVHEVKGTEPRAGTLNIKVYLDGSIMGFMGDTIVNLGWLNFSDRDNNELGEDASKLLEIGISRIINNSRMKQG